MSLLTLLRSNPGGSNVFKIQDVVRETFAASLAVPIVTSARSTLILTTVNQGGAVSSVVDSAGNTWIKVKDTTTDNAATAQGRASMWYLPSGTSAPITSVTVTQASSSALVVSVSEWSGLDPLAPLRSSNSSYAGGSSATQAATTAPTVAIGDLVIGTMSYFTGGATSPQHQIVAPFIKDLAEGLYATTIQAHGWKISETTSAQGPAWNFNTTGSVRGAVTAAFIPAVPKPVTDTGTYSVTESASVVPAAMVAPTIVSVTSPPSALGTSKSFSSITTQPGDYVFVMAGAESGNAGLSLGTTSGTGGFTQAWSQPGTGSSAASRSWYGVATGTSVSVTVNESTGTQMWRPTLYVLRGVSSIGNINSSSFSGGGYVTLPSASEGSTLITQAVDFQALDESPSPSVYSNGGTVALQFYEYKAGDYSIMAYSERGTVASTPAYCGAGDSNAVSWNVGAVEFKGTLTAIVTDTPIAANDTGTHSTTETSSVVSMLALTDTGTHSVTDTSSVGKGLIVFSPPRVITAPSTSTTFTVPSGVSLADQGLFVLTGQNTGGNDVTLTGPGTTNAIYGGQHGNMWVKVIQFQNTQQGDTWTVNITGTPSTATFDTVYNNNGWNYINPGAWTGRGGFSSNVNTSAPTWVVPGQRFVSIAFEHSAATSGNPTNVNSTGATPAGGLFTENATAGSISMVAYTANSNTTGTTTHTYSQSDTDGVALHIVENNPNAVRDLTDTGTHSTTETSSVSSIAFTSLSDTGTTSVTESVSIVATLSRADTGTHSTSDVSANFATLALNDSGTLSVTDASTNASSLSASDSGTLSTTESSAPQVNVTTSDAGTHSTTDASTLFITKPINDTGTWSATESSVNSSTVALNDTGTHSVTEAVSIAVVLSANDSGTLSAVDASTKTVPYQELSLTDGGTLSASDASSLQVSVATSDTGTHSTNDASTMFKAISTSDSGTHSTTETSGIALTYALTDTGTHSTSESSSLFINDAKNLTDTGTHSTTEGRSISGTATAADTGTHSAVDASTVFKMIAVNDTGTHSTTETAYVFNDRPTTDSGVHSTTETSSVAISGLVLKSASDTGTHSATEARTLAASSTRTDAGTHSAGEVISGSSTANYSDSGAVSATESAVIKVTDDTSDSGTHSVVEESDLQIFEGLTVFVWKGDHFEESNFRRWNGTAFVEVEPLFWNGTDWS